MCELLKVLYCIRNLLFKFFKNSYRYLVHRYWNSWIASGYFHCGCPQKPLCAFACMEWCCFPLKNLVVFRTSCNSCFELSKIRWVRLVDCSACLSAPAIHILKWVMHDKLPDVLTGSCWKAGILTALLSPCSPSCMHLLLLIWHFAAHMTYDTLLQREKLAENILHQNRKVSVPLNQLIAGGTELKWPLKRSQGLMVRAVLSGSSWPLVCCS